MTRFAPFPGLRYNTAVVALGDVVAPPYDVVNPTRRAQLAESCTYCVVHIDMPDDTRGDAGYDEAADLWQRWRRDAVLIADAPSLYVYRMDYDDEAGRAAHTVGVIGALALSPAHEGHVLPHEHTTPKAKTDRLQLIRATRANLSPIWGLSTAKGLSELLLPATIDSPTGEWRATDGTRHRLWQLTDPAALAAVSAAVDSAPVLIADGHHRYETSLTYQAERRAGGDAHGAFDRVMALVVELSADQLHVQPIHRLVAGLPHAFDLPAALASHFDVSSTDIALDALPDAMLRAGSLALLWNGRHFLLAPKPDAMRGVRDLDSSRLDAALAALPAHQLSYQHGLRHVAAALADGRADAAVLLRPVPLDQIEAIAHGGERMPPKSTYFHPKPSTGAVFMTVE